MSNSHEPGKHLTVYLCANCGQVQVGTHTPIRWYVVSLRIAGFNANGAPVYLKAGLYCSVKCLAGMSDGFEEVEAQLKSINNTTPQSE